MTNEYGPAVSQHQIEQAVIALLEGVPADGEAPLIVYYLAEQERQNGLDQQSLEQPGMYRGGTDFEQWKGDESPLIIVVVKTLGSPERLDTVQYRQDFQVQVAAVIEKETEGEARRNTSLYGVALMKLVSDHGSIGPNPYDPSVRLATHTEITGYPIADFAVNAQTARNIMRAVVTFNMRVAPVVAQGGPLSFTGSPYTSPESWPSVETVRFTVSGESPDGEISPAAGPGLTPHPGLKPEPALTPGGGSTQWYSSP